MSSHAYVIRPRPMSLPLARSLTRWTPLKSHTLILLASDTLTSARLKYPALHPPSRSLPCLAPPSRPHRVPHHPL